MFYNCRLYDYAVGQHVTFYTKTINTGTDNHTHENTMRTQNEERTQQQIQHSINVSYNRTKNKIYHLARSNSWDWFITITFDRQQTDATSYEEVTEKLQNFLEHLRQRKCPDLIYLIVPELHKDGKNYHFHGLLANCENMRFSYSGKSDKTGKMIFNISDWSFGFTTATRVGDTGKVSHYITKYITKKSTQLLANKKRYYASRNIRKVEPQYFTMDEETFLRIYGDRILHCKTVNLEDAGQQVKYYELSD